MDNTHYLFCSRSHPKDSFAQLRPLAAPSQSKRIDESRVFAIDKQMTSQPSKRNYDQILRFRFFGLELQSYKIVRNGSVGIAARGLGNRRCI